MSRGDVGSRGSDKTDFLDAEYAKETSLSHMISRIGTASERSFENKKRVTRKKVSKLTKPIEASINIDHDEDLGPHKFLANFTDDIGVTRAESRNNMNRKAKEELLTRIRFASDDYQSIFKDNSTSVRPLINFFKTLIPRPAGPVDQSNLITRSKLQLALPYTVVYGVEENPVLYYTSKEGYVTRVDNPSSRIVKKKLTYDTHAETDLAVVLKRPLVGETVTNHSSLLSMKQVSELLENQSQGTCVFQRYVKCKGSKACIARIVWSSSSPCSGYMISNKKNMFDTSEKEPAKRLLVNTDNPNSMHIYKMNGSAVSELERVVAGIVRYIQNNSKPKVSFSEMACDFIRDEEGQYWFLQVKALKLDHPSKPAAEKVHNDDGEEVEVFSKRKKEYIRLKECKMCLNQYPPNDLTFAMSLKMIYATERHLKRRSVKLAWFDRPEFNNIKDTSVWYQAHKVCKNCFDMYLQEQKLAKVEVQFAKAIGIPVDEKANDGASIITSLYEKLGTNRLLRKDAQKSAISKPSSLVMYRFITYLNELRNVPETVPSKFNLKMSIFGIETCVPLKLEKAQTKIIDIGKLRVFYFFVKDEEHFRKWINEEKKIVVNLCIGDDMIGYANLQLNQFGSNLIDKLDYMVLFSSTKLKLCSLRATLGFVQMRYTDVSNIELQEQKSGVYTPPVDFFTADPLPEEWMEIIPRLSTSATRRVLSARGPASPARKGPPSRQRPASASVVSTMTKKNRALLTSQGLGSFANEGDGKPKRPFSASSRILSIRAKSAAKLNSLDNHQFNLSYRSARGHSSNSLNISANRPQSATISRRVTRTQSNWKTESQSPDIKPPKLAFGVDLEKTDDSHFLSELDSPLGSSASDDLRNLPRYGPKEIVWIVTLKIPSVHEMHSRVDETWVMSFHFLNILRKEYESFQLFSEGPLIFDVELEHAIVATEENLMAFFGKERLFKIIFTPKFSLDEEFVAAIDMRQLQKSLALDQDVPVEKIRSDEVDDTKFMDVDSEDEKFVEDESDDEDGHEPRQETDTKVKVSIVIKKLGRMVDMEHESVEEIVHEATIEEFGIHILKGKPFQLPQVKKSVLKKS